MKRLLAIPAVLSLLLLPALPARAQVSFSVSVGTPPPPPRVYRVAPPPGPTYQWVEGYWYPQGKGGHYKWHDGYWTQPPFSKAYWVQPYWQSGRYFEGYWSTPRGHYDHDHHWDRDGERDANREWRDHRDHDDRDHGKR
jgi:hypothetical protein